MFPTLKQTSSPTHTTTPPPHTHIYSHKKCDQKLAEPGADISIHDNED